MSAPARYDDLGTVNAVKLLPKIDSYNGYIKLYTELDSHIEEGDTVFITFSGDTTQLNIATDIILDNYTYIIYDNDFIYNQFAQGYKVIYVDKMNNSFVINRFIFTIPNGKKLYGHYVSRVVCNNIVINKAKIDGTLFKYGVIDSSGMTSNIVFQQGVVLDGDVIDCDIIDKYTNNYVSLLLNYTDSTNTFIKYSNLNNNDYGYSYFYNLNSSLVNCNISSGNYYHCHIENTTGSEKYIDGGYFYNCLIDEYHIYDGYFHNTEQLTNECVWHYGKWDSETFTLNKWEDGIFLNGTFGAPNQKTIWQNGLFLNGNWKGLIWANGDFSGGVFLGTGYTEYSGQKIGTQWFNGKFKGGVMTNGAFNTIFWKDGDVYGGELNNVVFNSGNIYDGVFYNITAKNVNIYGGDFKTIKGTTPKFNTFANSTIYNGNFSSKWCGPKYIISNFHPAILSYTYGYNEFSDSKINNGTFKYPIFYNFNTIYDGDFENGFFLSPTDIYNGKFYGGYLNKVGIEIGPLNSSINIRSNLFNSEKVTMSKGSIRSKILLNDSGVTETKIYIEFDNGHNFNEYDAGKVISLIGFNSQELYNTDSVIIEKNKYFDLSKPTSMLVSSYTYEYVEPIGDNYIIIEKPYKSWMFGDTGLIKKMEWTTLLPLVASASTDYYNIYNGIFNNSNFFGNINIYNGVFNNATMKNGIQWYNGIFDGGIFQSQSGKSDNIWYDGQFYNGVFGLNVLGQKETSRLTFFIDKCEIDNSSLGPQTSTTYLLKAIYPLVYSKVVNEPEIITNTISAFLTSDNTLSQDWVRMVTDDRSKKYMNTSVWGRETPYAQSDITSGSVDYFISPYNFVFRIDCNSYESRMTLKKMLDFVASDTSYNVSIISPSDPVNISETIMIGETVVTYTSRTYRTFQEMFGMNYDYVEYIMGAQSGSTYPIYIIFRFNTIKDLYDNCTDSEKELFALNFRNVWSIANTGYYTHPMPVLYEMMIGGGTSDYGNEDIQKVGKMSIKLSDGTYVTNNKWIYGTCPPPWWISGSTTPYINWEVMFTENGITSTLIDSVGTYTNSIGSKISNNGITCDGYTIPENLISSRIYDSINRSVYDVDELSTTNYQTPYMRRRFTEWLFHYIYQHKNHSGYNFSSSGVSFRQIYNDQVLVDPKFNIVKDFRTQLNCKLNNLIYNSQVFKCQVIGHAVYFDNNFNLSDYFSIGDKIYLENTTVLSGGVTTSFAAFALSSSLPVADTTLDDGEYTITAISGYNYLTNRSNILWITGFGVSDTTNSSANAYIMNQGLIVPYYYYVGKNGVYSNMISQCNSETFFHMAPYNNTNTGITLNPEYSETANTFISLNYKNQTNKLGIRMQPIFHTYYPDPGFYVNIPSLATSQVYYQHRNVYYCEVTKPGAYYRLIFKNVMPWSFATGDTFQNAQLLPCFFGGITGNSSLSSYLNPTNIKSAWKYDENSTNWISLSYYSDTSINNKIKGTWRVGNSGITGGNFYVEIIDPNFNNVPAFTLPTGPTGYVHVGIEPTPSCAGKIVNIMYKNEDGVIKTINTTILDYDFINKAYIFDVSPAGVYINATDIWLGTNMKSYNVFNLSTGFTLTSPYTVATPSFNPQISYNVQNWNSISPFSMTKSTVTFPNSFEKLSINPYRDYLISTIIKYSGSTINESSPISAQRIVNINDIPKTTPVSNVYDSTLNKLIYKDLTQETLIGEPTKIYQTSTPIGYSSGWSNNGRNYEQEKSITEDYWNNTHLLEKITFIRTKTSSVEILTTDKIQIEILSNYNTNMRPIIKEVNFLEKMSDNEFKSLYPNYHIDSYSGMTKFGVYQVESNDSQNRIWSYMKSNIANNLPNDLVWYYGDVDYSNYHNFQDAALFSVYHSYMKNNLSNYSSFDIDDVFMRYLFYDMKNSSSGYSNIYNNILTENDKENFKNWNSRVQTSTQNFNKKAGIQIYSRNVSANISDFKDQWYNGEFYGYRFEGGWHGGKWISGNWFGWNLLNTDETTTGDTAFIKPSDFDLSAKQKVNYETNYTLLKKKKKYYDIAPWDEANKNNSETINLPLRKKDR